MSMANDHIKTVDPRALSVIMPTIDWGSVFEVCARAVGARLGPNDEFLVVFDGPQQQPPKWLSTIATQVLHTGIRSGPAVARNMAARRAQSGNLVFVDADVELHPDALERIRSHLVDASGPDAVFGSYDNRPAARGLVSQFRNLLHHHTHTSHPGPAVTFWAGCGAMRRAAFLTLGGFDATKYRLPSIEDVELGIRLSGAGGSILLDPSIQCTHHKRWTLSTMLRTDIFQRAIPWSNLMFSHPSIPKTLNLSLASRISAGLSFLIVVALGLSVVDSTRLWSFVVLAPAIGSFLVLNGPFLGLLRRRGGARLAIVGGALLGVYYLYSSMVFALVLLVNVPRLLKSFRADPTL